MKYCAILLVVMTPFCVSACSETIVLSENFSGQSDRWEAVGNSVAAVLIEPSNENHVLQLVPVRRGLSYILFDTNGDLQAFEMTGRILFPKKGDGYVGFVYSHRSNGGRTDYGCIYIKSNGSYVRFSPHFDGNPSWRLFEELRVDLSGEHQIQVGRWYPFRLVVVLDTVSLYLDDFESPVFSTNVLQIPAGRVGIEARPGGGEPVWIDDIRIREIGSIARSTPLNPQTEIRLSQFSQWLVYNSTFSNDDVGNLPVDRGPDNWIPAMQDRRGAIITGAHADYSSSMHTDVLLKSKFFLEKKDIRAKMHLKISSANELLIWLNGKEAGTVSPGDYIWSDHASNVRHAGASIRIDPVAGENELVILAKGGRFAAGGFFVALGSDP